MIHFNYVDNEMVWEFSLALMDHQITHFIDDITGMEIELTFHEYDILIMIARE